MNHWIFQSVPQNYDLRVEFKESLITPWIATRYRTRMNKGDIIFFWLAGSLDTRGIYGWGSIVSEPLPMESSWGKTWGVNVKYEKRLGQPLLARDFMHSPLFANLMIFRAPFGTNFLISHNEAKAIAKMISADQRPEV